MIAAKNPAPAASSPDPSQHEPPQHGHPQLGIGLDTGGTYTDAVLWNLEAQRLLRQVKTPTTHGDYTHCIRRAFAELALTPHEIRALQRVALSTTLATNAITEGRLHPTLLILEAADVTFPNDIHDRWIALESCIDFRGNEVRPFSSAELLQKIAQAGDVEEVAAFAVSGYASTRNDAHERAIAACLRSHFGKPVVLGSQLSRQLGFALRARTTAWNGGLLPIVTRWLRAVRGMLAAWNIEAPLYIVKGDASLMTVAQALEQPLLTLGSGPAASLRGAAMLAVPEEQRRRWMHTLPTNPASATPRIETLSEAPSRTPDETPSEVLGEALVIDVGGTTCDIGPVRQGQGILAADGMRIAGHRLAVAGLQSDTHGLAGDSALSLRGGSVEGQGGGQDKGQGGNGSRRFCFGPGRVVPFSRLPAYVRGWFPGQLAEALDGQWHFGDLAQLDLLLRDSHGSPGASRLDELFPAASPRRTETLPMTLEGLPRGVWVERMIAERRLLRVGITPTDVAVLGDRLVSPRFSKRAAREALDLHAHLLDIDPGQLLRAWEDEIRTQALGMLLAAHLTDPPPLETPWLQGLLPLFAREASCERSRSGDSSEGARLQLHPARPLILVGAGASLLFDAVPRSVASWVQKPRHGAVANAVGAICSPFILRLGATVEPRKGGDVEVFAVGRRARFDTPALGIEAARGWLCERLEEEAARLNLHDAQLHIAVEKTEDYADFSKRQRRELVIARLRACLQGYP